MAASIARRQREAECPTSVIMAVAMDRPDLPPQIFAAVTETLALWLARGWNPVATDVSAWSAAHWRAALWVAYWDAALQRGVEGRHEADLPAWAYLAEMGEGAGRRAGRDGGRYGDVAPL